MALPQKVIPLPVPEKPKRKPKNMTSDGRRCVRVDAGTDPKTGRRIRKAFYGKTLKEAQQKAQAYKLSMADGVDLAARDQPLSQWIDTWLDTYGRKGAPATIVAHERYARFLSDALGRVRLGDLRPIHLQRFADSLSDHSHGSVQRIRIIVQMIIRSAITNRILTYDPTLGVTWTGREDGSHRMLTREEISALTAHWQEHPLGAPVMVMLYAGLRRGEVLGLRWEDIDLSANLIHVRQAMQIQLDHNTLAPAAPKTRSSVRDVPILPILRAVLTQLPPASGLLFPGYPTASSFICAFERYVVSMRAHLGPAFTLRPHDLRHTFASLCYESGVDVKTTQSLLGHSSPAITMDIYTHLSVELKSASISSLSNFTSTTFGHQMGITTPETP